jgi:hypothetical protein
MAEVHPALVMPASSVIMDKARGYRSSTIRRSHTEVAVTPPLPAPSTMTHAAFQDTVELVSSLANRQRAQMLRHLVKMLRSLCQTLHRLYSKDGTAAAMHTR